MNYGLQPYLDEEGRVTRWPGRRFRQDIDLILNYLAGKFEPGRTYTEKEVNAILNAAHTFEDWALLRRELFDKGYLNRTKDGAQYWRTPDTRMV